MKCPNCGFDLPDNAAFCANCGTNLSNADQAPAQPSGQAQAHAQEPSTATAKDWRHSMPLRIVLLVAGIALMISGILKLTGAFGSKKTDAPTQTQTQTQAAPQADTQAQSNTPTQTDAQTQADTQSQNQTNAPSTSAVEKTDAKPTETPTTVEAPATLTAECFDEHGWVTDYAFLELTGADLVQALKSKGYTVKSQESVICFSSADGSCLIGISDENGWLPEEEIVKLGKNGEGRAVYCLIISGPHDSLAQALKTMNTCVLQDYKQADDGKTGMGVVYGPSMKQNVVVIDDADDGDYRLEIYTQESISSGLFNKLSEAEFGTSVDEIWQTVTGGFVGDYIRDHPVA